MRQKKKEAGNVNQALSSAIDTLLKWRRTEGVY